MELKDPETCEVNFAEVVYRAETEEWVVKWFGAGSTILQQRSFGSYKEAQDWLHQLN